MIRHSVRPGTACDYNFSSQIVVSEILELTPDLAHTETVGERRIDFYGLSRNGFAAVGREVRKRPHVVEPVGKLDHDDPDVVGHGKKHLAEILGLLCFFVGELDLTDLGYYIDDVSDLRSENI